MFAALRRRLLGSAEPQPDDDITSFLIRKASEEQLLTPEAYSKQNKTNNGGSTCSSNLRHFLQAATCIMFMYLVLTRVYDQTQPAPLLVRADGTITSMTSTLSHQNMATSKHSMRHNRITSEIHVQNSKAVSPVVCILGNAQVRTLVLDSVDAGRHRRRSAEVNVTHW
jgi:hypothetical protein